MSSFETNQALRTLEFQYRQIVLVLERIEELMRNGSKVATHLARGILGAYAPEEAEAHELRGEIHRYQERIDDLLSVNDQLDRRIKELEQALGGCDS